MRHTRDAVAEIDADGLVRRQKFTTWGILALAVFVSVGMAEWSKRSAADEVIVDEKIFQQAIQIAAERKMEDRRWEMGISDFGFRNSDAGKNLSDLGVLAVKSLSTAEAQRRGGVFHSGGNEAGKIETSAGANQ